ncbi:hypothetical protein M413DRAFT_445266 [Hebeloma cylindrosporum]|uniref:F-box domain-containing protein n=1 Tax=Hebeloma cylindrosporum TaxID=76867 RepID=A0A0C3BXC9_HEBCY|nr:hypothetical protein M413DRAFT_445266 [Hebeloma cylindrosporum h7]
MTGINEPGLCTKASKYSPSRSQHERDLQVTGEILQPLGVRAREPSTSDSVPYTMATLCDLPTEVLLEIIQQLDNPALVNLARTCHCVHFLALDTFFSKNDIWEPKSGWVVAYNTPVETLPALHIALFVQWLDQLHYWFNFPMDRMIEEVRALRALVSRLPTIRLVKLHFSVVDQHYFYEQGALDPVVWKKEVQSLLDLILEKGCSELSVQGGETLVKLYPHHGGVVAFPAEDINVRRRKQLRGLFGKVGLRPFMEFANQFFAPSQDTILETATERKVTIPTSNAKPTHLSIHSDMLLQNPFLEWTMALLSSAASTIRTLSIKFLDLPQETWKIFLNNVNLPQLLDFKITSDIIVPLDGVSFIDIHAFLSHHSTTIETLQLYGVGTPRGVWDPSTLTTPILSRLQRIIAHPCYTIWILNNLVMDNIKNLLLNKDASPNLTEIGIASESHRGAAPFYYSLFDEALERIATFPSKKIKLTLRFASFGRSDVTDWIQKHLATNNASKSTIISRLNNVTSLVISSFSNAKYDYKVIEMLPDWLGMFANVTAIEFTDQHPEIVKILEEKEFVRKVAMACPKVGLLDVQTLKFDLDEVRKDLTNAEGGG